MQVALAGTPQHRGTAEAGDYSLRALMHEACLVHHLPRLKRQRVGYEELMMVHDWRPLEQLGFSRPESQRLLAALEKARGPQLPASPPLAQAIDLACVSLPCLSEPATRRLAGSTTGFSLPWTSVSPVQEPRSPQVWSLHQEPLGGL